MKSTTIISVKHLSKIYTMQTKLALWQRATAFLSNNCASKNSKPFYALIDVTFKVNKGESLAIFDHNRSGKTTLLQLLANVMNPTSGSIEVKGRYTALLGATLDLMQTMTGIENINLMAAMYRVRLDREPELLDEIVAFADIGDFINGYVKNYPSDMKARIGFSVAIHVLPEIIFIDKVLSVGDVHFKKKCSDKIMQLREEDRTYLIVAHNIGSVEGLCERAIWLDKGEISMDESIQKIWGENLSFKRAIRNRSTSHS